MDKEHMDHMNWTVLFKGNRFTSNGIEANNKANNIQCGAVITR